MSFWSYCCTKNNFTANPIDAGCGSPNDPTFYHLHGRVSPVECEKNDWKSIGNFYAIDADGSLWSIAGTGIAGVNYFNKGLPYKDNYCQVDDSTDWTEIIPGHYPSGLLYESPNELFLKGDTVYTLNTRNGLDIQNGSLTDGRASFPIPYKNFYFYNSSRFGSPFDHPLLLPVSILSSGIKITKAEAYDTIFGSGTDNNSLCYNKITYISDFKLAVGDLLDLDWDIVSDSGYPSGLNFPYVNYSLVKVDHIISNTEFLTTTLMTLSELNDFSKCRVWIRGLNFETKVRDFVKSYSDAEFAEYTLDSPVARARISSRIKKYLLLPSNTNDPDKTILDDIQFSRKPTLHVKCYRPSSTNLSSNDLDIDGFYHQCSNYIRDNNVHYYHDNDKPVEEVEALWRGKIDWIIANTKGLGYFYPPNVRLIQQASLDSNENPASGMTPSGLVSVSPPTGIVTINELGEISGITITNNPYVWAIPPKIVFDHPYEAIGSYDFTLNTFNNKVKTSSINKLGTITPTGPSYAYALSQQGFIWDSPEESVGLSISVPTNTTSKIMVGDQSVSISGFGHYTIAMRCSLSAVSGSNRLINFDISSDPRSGGLYIQNGGLYLNNTTDPGQIPRTYGSISENQIVDIVITRNNIDNIFNAYIDGQHVYSFNDSNFITMCRAIPISVDEPPSSNLSFLSESDLDFFANKGVIQKINIWNNPISYPDIYKTLSYPPFIEASGICEIIGPIQGINVLASGDGYTHAAKSDSKLVLVAQANIDDLYVHGIPISITPTPFATPSFTPSNTYTPTVSLTKTPTSSNTPSITPTKSITPTATASYSSTPIATNTPTSTPTPYSSFTPTPSVTISNSLTPTITSSQTNSLPVSPTASVSSGQRIGSTPALFSTPTPTSTPPPSASKAINITATPSPTPTLTISRTPSNTPSHTATQTLSPTPYSPTPTPTQTPSSSITSTVTPSFTRTCSLAPTTSINVATPTPTPTITLTPSATSRIRKNKLKQWPLADIELYPSEISTIEFTRPLFSFDSLLKSADLSNPIPGSSIFPESKIILYEPLGSTRESTTIVLGETLLSTTNGIYKPYTNPDIYNANTIGLGIYSNSYNYLSPEKKIKIKLNNDTKNFLNRSFNHEHFKEAFIYGPGKRKEYITADNINGEFDYSELHLSQPSDLNLYVCMDTSVSSVSENLLDARELYVRYGDPNEPDWSLYLEGPIFNINDPNDEDYLAYTFIARVSSIDTYNPFSTTEPIVYFTEAGPMIPKISDIECSGADPGAFLYGIKDYNGLTRNYVSGVTTENPVARFFKMPNKISPPPELDGSPYDIGLFLTISNPGDGPDRSLILKRKVDNRRSYYGWYPPPYELKYYDNPGKYELGCSGDIRDFDGRQLNIDPCCTPMVRTFRSPIMEIPQYILDSTDELVTYDDYKFNRIDLIYEWQNAIDTARGYNTYDENQSDNFFHKGRKLCDIVKIKGGDLNNITDYSQIEIMGSGTSRTDPNALSRTYSNGLLITDNFIDVEFIERPVNIPAKTYAYRNDTGITVHDVAFSLRDITIQATPTGLFVEDYNTEPPPSETLEDAYDYFYITNDSAIREYIDSVKPKQASVSTSGGSNGYKYYYKLKYFGVVPTINSKPTERILINHNFPNSKKETGKIYFPANSFGDGAIAELNTIIGPSGYIMCDSATLITNNSYISEPEGLIRTVGYDIPTKISHPNHNFVPYTGINFYTGGVEIGTFNSKYRLLSNNNELYIAQPNMLYKEGGGIKFDFKTQIMNKDFLNDYHLQYVVSPPDSLNSPNSVQANVNISKLDTQGSLPADGISNSMVLSLNPFTGNNEGNFTPNIDIGFGYYEDPEVLNLGFLINIFFPYSGFNDIGFVYGGGFVELPLLSTLTDNVPVPHRNFEPESLGLLGSVIPFKYSSLYSGGVAVSEDGKLALVSQPLTKPKSNIIFIEPQSTAVLRVAVDTSVFIDAISDIGNVDNIIWFEPTLDLVGNGNGAKFTVNLQENIINDFLYPDYIGYPGTDRSFWSISSIDIVSPGSGYTQDSSLNVIEQDPFKTLRKYSLDNPPEQLLGPGDASITISNVGPSGEILDLLISNSGRYYSEDAFLGYCEYYPNLKGGLKHGKLAGVIPNFGSLIPLASSIVYKKIAHIPYFYILDCCSHNTELINYIRSQYTDIKINQQDGLISIPVDIVPNGDTVPFPSGWSVFGQPLAFDQYRFHIVYKDDWYAPDSEYNYNTVSGSISFGCGCIEPNSIGTLTSVIFPYLSFISPYFSDYTVTVSNGGPQLSNIKYKNATIIEISDIEREIEYQNYSIINTDSISSSIKGASDGTYIFWILDNDGTIKYVYIPSDNNNMQLYAIIPCGACKFPLTKTFKALKGRTLISDDDQSYQL